MINNTSNLMQINSIAICPERIVCIRPADIAETSTFIGVDGVCDEFNNNFIILNNTSPQKVMDAYKRVMGQKLNIVV